MKTIGKDVHEFAGAKVPFVLKARDNEEWCLWVGFIDFGFQSEIDEKAGGWRKTTEPRRLQVMLSCKDRDHPEAAFDKVAITWVK